MADRGHELTDELLGDMEKKVAREYKQAVEETQKKLDAYLQRFAEQDAKKRAQLKAGEITRKDYNRWKTGQIAMGQRWEEMRDTLAQDYHNANLIARSTIDGYMPEVYALNHNYATFQIEHDANVDTSYTLYDRQTVERIMRDDPDLLPPPGKSMTERLKNNPDIAWQQGQIQSATVQSILQGDSVPTMAKRIAQTMGETNYKNAVRYARTATTGAQNAGRLDGYKRAQSMGIGMKQTWLATLDGRTRHEHRQLDGQTVDVDKPFEVDGYKLKFPGDPTAPGYLVWNCRCTTIANLTGFERDLTDMNLRKDDKLGGMSYDEWKEAKSTQKGKQSVQKPPEEKKRAVPEDAFKNVKGITEEFSKAMADKLDSCGVEVAQKVFTKYADELACVDPKSRKAYFWSTKGGVFMNLDRVANGDSCHTPLETAFHEFGHMIDWLGNNKNNWTYLSNKPVNGKRLQAVIRSDFQKFKKACGVSRAAEVIPVLKAENMDLYTAGNISDILEKSTGQSYPLGVGHGASYHKRDGATEAEFFAEVLDSAVANPKAYEQMVRLFPNAVDMVWTMIKGVL